MDSYYRQEEEEDTSATSADLGIWDIFFFFIAAVTTINGAVYTHQKIINCRDATAQAAEKGVFIVGERWRRGYCPNTYVSINIYFTAIIEGYSRLLTGKWWYIRAHGDNDNNKNNKTIQFEVHWVALISGSEPTAWGVFWRLDCLQSDGLAVDGCIWSLFLFDLVSGSVRDASPKCSWQQRQGCPFAHRPRILS